MPCATMFYWYSGLCLLLLNLSNHVLSSSTTVFDEDFAITTVSGALTMEEEAAEGSGSSTAQEYQRNSTRINESKESEAKEKVDQLGQALKKKVEMLQMHDDGKLDIVFLIDASSSMGDENFMSELKFVKKLLADFTISVNETRVAVITFSDPDKVIRHIDHITVPSAENHKCNMLNNHLLNINYTGGLTYTLGALLEAQGVLMWSRKGAQKAVFLITDGFSNGGDPVPVAQILKDNGTYIFTFGIQSGNIIELENISSAPAEEFSYLVDSFGQFEAVVRRALHQDLSSGFYQRLSNLSPCNLLCSSKISGDCCDSQAHCSCGTGTGHYRCLCNPGYYGSGLKDSCTACPSGTYHDGQTPGDESVCLPCPDPNHITNVGNASSRASCVCKRGFAARGDFCEGIICPPIYPPENGYFVKGGMCQNVFNAACGVRCKAGYTLHGSSIRLCQENSTWSGKAAKCTIKMCPNPEMPPNGNMSCSLAPSVSNDLLDPTGEDLKSLLYAVDTECQFTCRPGHALVGSRRRICLPLARWDGLRTLCKPITCRSLPQVSNGLVSPASCTVSSKLPFGQKCNITCDRGYKLIGPSSRKCGGKGGQWSMKSTASKCLDEEPPTIMCPANIETSSDFGEAFATVVVPLPSTSDNSGQPPIVWSQPSISSPLKIPIGIVQITFIAMDLSHNQALCNMTITVVDKEPPMIETCISPNRIHLIETGGNHTVTWLEPEFYDNSGEKPSVVSSHSYGEFPVGKTEVKVIATDESGNNSTCVLVIVVEDSPCRHQPNHATTICNFDNDTSISCTTNCNEGYAFDSNGLEENKFLSVYDNGSLHYSCPVVKDVNFMHFIDSFTLPQCSETVLPNSLSQEGEMTFIANEGACNDTELLSKVKNLVHLELSKRSEEICSASETACSIFNTNATCEEIASLEEEETNTILRRKRSIGPLMSNQSYKTQSNTRETIAASSINIHFNVNSQLRTENPEIRQLGNNGFGQLKDSLSRSFITLPPNINRQTFSWKGEEVMACSNGSVPHSSAFCVKCPPGSYFTTPPHKCIPCPLGKYQSSSGQSSCLSCPKGMSTRYVSSQSLHDCNYLCQPGTYGHSLKSDNTQNGNSFSPCFPCNPGSFQPNYGAAKCLQCPTGLHSYRKGAKSIKECLKTSGKASWSPSSSCSPHVCLNGGLCRSVPLGFISCDCQQGFYGSVCELVIDDCGSSPCLNGGQCDRKKPSGYHCKCLPGFHGTNCEEDTDECRPNPCLNNSTCEDLDNGYFCDCLEGFQGLNCSENIDDCFNNPCGDHGICIDGVANYSCSCIDGYLGRYCDVEPADPCLENACINGGSCVTLNSSVFSFRCICPTGWEGEYCEKEHDSCLSSPCLNNGICSKKMEGKFLCHCPANFAGDICQTSLNSDFILYMPSPSVTDYSIVEFPSQNLTQLSACLWLKSQDGLNYGSAFSYATKNQPNSFTLTDYNGFVLYVNGERVVTDVSANDGLWHHICVLWESYQGLWSIHLDGILRDNGSGLSPNHSVQGGGKLVLGQEQDRFGGGFSESESLIGRVYRLDVWDYLLSVTEIVTLARECAPSLDGSVVRWTDFLPRIRGKIVVENSTFCSECPSLSSFWHGIVKLVQENNITIASYECDSGFVLHKSKLTKVKRRCLKHGSWEGNPPVCVRRNCGFPGYLPGGTFSGRSFLYTDTIKYICHFGAQILGNTTRVCQADGKWSGEPPICKGRECQLLKPPEHGAIVLGKGAGGIQTASFSCEDGFHIDGAHNLTCMYDGTWDETVPDCLRNACPSPPEISHGVIENISGRQFLYQEKVYYECEPEYEIAPGSPSAMQCNKDGEWCPSFSNPQEQSNVILPVCELKHCRQPDALEYGSWILKYGLIINHVNYSIGSVLAAECETNYNIFGPKSKFCKDKMWWPLEVTQCAKIICDTEGLPYDLPHSILDVTGEEVNDRATLSCKKNYQLSRAKGALESDDYLAELVPEGKISWECKPDGSWSMSSSHEATSSESEIIACLPELQKNVPVLNIPCDLPKPPDFGYLVADRLKVNNSVGAIVEVRCRPGFWLDGPYTMVCGSNGTWLSGSTCKPIKCHSPPHFPSMILTSTTAVGQDEEFGNMATFECLPGFQRVGDLSVRCQLTGNWSLLRGKCIPLHV